ncbi:MAG: glycosyltransferase family 2 protein [Pseudomonadota bacterium]|nr:glycosyltransferase family 2 protein [Pseudomonadota bacterium]
MLTIIIVNFNTGELLCHCLASVLSSQLELQLFLVDNGSSDGSLQQVQQQFGCDSRVTIIENGTNLGFARANNIVLRQLPSECTYVLLLNPDCLVPPGTLERMTIFMNSHSQVGIAGCFIANPDGSEQRGCRRLIPTPENSFSEFIPRFFGSPKPVAGSFNLAGGSLPPQPVEVEAISGSFMFVRRLALEIVGELDQGYFLHCEDLDWCKRFALAGWKIFFVPDVKVIHHQGTCSRSRYLRVSWHKHCGMLRFYRKFYRADYGFAVFVLAVVFIWLRFVMAISVAFLTSWLDREN